MGPLEGLRVLEIGSLVAGPLAGTLLADLGADVVKVEHPTNGDSTRSFGPQKDGQGLLWKTLARNKWCITLDLVQPRGQELLRRLAAQSDAVIENFRPGTLERWNVGYEQLKAV